MFSSEMPEDVRTRGDVLERILRRAEYIDLNSVLPRSNFALPPDVETFHMDRNEAYETLRALDVSIVAADGSHVSREFGIACLGISCSASAFFEHIDVLKVDEKRACLKEGIHVLAAENGPAWISVREARDTYVVAKKLVEKEVPDIVLLDGPLLIRPDLLRLDEEGGDDLLESRRYYDDLRECVLSVLELVKECEERNVYLVGVVKRPQSKVLAKRVGLKIRDVAILAPKMSVGDVVVLEGPGKHPALEVYREIGIEEGVTFSGLVSGKWLRVLYVKTAKVPLRLEVPYFTPPEVAAQVVLATSDKRRGIPWPIQAVDNLCKVGMDALKLLVRSLYRKGWAVENEGVLEPLPGHEL